MVAHVLHDLGRGEQLLRVVVRDLEPELVLHGHDDLHVVQRVQPEVLHEVRLQLELLVVDLVVEVEDEEDALGDVLDAHGLGAAVAADGGGCHSRERQEERLRPVLSGQRRGGGDWSRSPLPRGQGPGQ